MIMFIQRKSVHTMFSTNNSPQECRLIYNIYIWMLIIFMFTFSMCNCDTIDVVEWEVVCLEFPYPCSSTDVTLQYGNRAPFYHLSETLSLPPDQIDRLEVQNITDGSNCSLHLRINHVKRTDTGTYILLANDYDYIKRIWLDVDFPPGKPQCKSIGKHFIGDWVELHCTASVGSMVGQIQCYQGGTLLPQLRAPFETWRTLEQTILVQQNQYNVFCCSTPAMELKQKCECNEFVWDPISESEAITKHPCPTTTHVPISTTSPADQKSKHGLSLSLASASPRISDEMIFIYPKRKSVTWYIPVIAVMVIFMISMFILNVVIFISFRKERVIYGN